MGILNEAPKCYDTKGRLIRKGQICNCSPGSLVKRPFKVRIIEVTDPDPSTGSFRIMPSGEINTEPYLCTELLDKSGHKVHLHPEWARKRLTIIKD